MKIRTSVHARQQGTVMLVCLMVAGVIGTTLASYLLMTQNQNVSIYRSQTWNTSMALTEAGVEDGLQLINTFAGSFDDLAKWTNNATSDSWDNTNAANVYHMQRTIGSDYYDVYVTNANNTPYVTAYSTLGWNFQYTTTASAVGMPQSMFAAVTVNPSST